MGERRSKSLFFRCILSLFAALLLAASFSAPVFANADLEAFDASLRGGSPPAELLEGAGVLSGLAKPAESTFDTFRTIVGSAPKDTTVTITIYAVLENQFEQFEQSEQINRLNRAGDYEPLREYALVVGQSGVFSKTVDLDQGRNFVCITFENDGKRAMITALVNRKDVEIKKELEQSGNLVNLGKP